MGLLLTCFLSTLFIVGCVKTEGYYPGISIYKTNGDYFDLVTIGLKDGKVVRKPGIYFGTSLVFTDTDTIYKSRIRLANGYVLDTQANSVDSYLKLTWKELFLKESKTEGHNLSR